MAKQILDPAQSWPSRGALVAACGARAVEAALLRDVKRLCADAQRDPKLLVRPARIIVASNRLRENLCAKLTQDFGVSIAGLTVQTLYYVAKEALERSGESAASANALFSAFVREAVKAERDLFRDLHRTPNALDAKDGFESLVATVHDLVDAGFTAETEEFLCERLAAVKVSQPSAARAQAIVRVAAKVLRAFDHLNVSHRTALLQRATQCIARDPARALPARAILIHGFADATGVATDLLEALVQHGGAKIFFDFPPDPAQPVREVPTQTFAQEGVASAGAVRSFDCAWSEPLRARLSGVAGRVNFEAATPGSQSTQIRVFQACGALEEVREMARRIRQSLDGGAVPEKIAIVARDFEAYAALLRSELLAAGIPFSGSDTHGPRSHDGNVLLRLLQLLREQDVARIELWVSLCAQTASRAGGEPESALKHQADLQARMTQFGVMRVKDLQPLSDLRALILSKHKRATSALAHADAAKSEGDEAELAADEVNFKRQRFVLSPEFAQMQKRFTLFQKLWKDWPVRASLAAHQARFEEFVKQWYAGVVAEEAGRAQRILDAMHEDWPSGCEVDFATFLKILDEKAASFGYLDLGGQGAGVQVLSVMDARACTFESVFVLGLQRGSFPRLITEDALFSDALRDALRDMLPDLPAKRRGFDEERFLFAQLCHGAPQVTLSFYTVDFDGKPKNPSPFIERLRLARVALADESAPPLYPKLQSDTLKFASTLDLAIQFGLSHQRNFLQHTFALALREAQAASQNEQDEDGLTKEKINFDAAAAAHMRILQEFECSRSNQHYSEFSPYSGFVEASLPAAQYPGPLYVTRLEALAKCPWQFFLKNVLKISPTVDLRSSFFDRDAAFGGNFVHRVLAKIAKCGEPTESGAYRAAWPIDSALHALWDESLEELLAKEDFVFSSALRVQSKNWWECLEVAKEDLLQATQKSFEIIGVEEEGCVSVKDQLERARELHFRADRIDRSTRGDAVQLRFTDYKIGKLPDKKDFTNGLRRGTSLQATAYIHSDLASSRISPHANLRADTQAIVHAVGRYLYLKSNQSGEYSVDSNDEEGKDQFYKIVAMLFLLRDRSVFFPRIFESVEEKKSADACKYCSFAVACHRSDIAFQARFEAWLDAARKISQELNTTSPDQYTLQNVFEEGWKLW